MIIYPAVYTTVDEEEMVYLAGGITVEGTKNFIKLVFTDPLAAIKKFNEKTKKLKNFFDWVIGDYMRDSVVLTDFRADLWQSAKSGNLDAFDSRMKSFDEMSTPGQLLYVYGIFRVGETVFSYWK